MDDLVKQLRDGFANCDGGEFGGVLLTMREAADRIEALEAQLAKADALAGMNAARDFPVNTCPASRHAQMIAEALIEGRPYPMLTEEPEHCGESIAAVVTALYEARSKLKQMEP